MQYSQRALATTSLALTAFTSSLAYGSVLTVAPSGANYTQIQAAVTAATDGDVILISPGAYGAVTIDGKGLTLVKQGISNVTIVGTTTVRNLSASQRVILSGLSSLGQPSAQYTATDGMGLLIENNAGNVRVEYCSFFGANGWWDNTHGPSPGFGCYLTAPECKGRNGALLYQNTAGVSFSVCEIRAGHGASGEHDTIWECGVGYSERGGDGLLVVATLASLTTALAPAVEEAATGRKAVLAAPAVARLPEPRRPDCLRRDPASSAATEATPGTCSTPAREGAAMDCSSAPRPACICSLTRLSAEPAVLPTSETSRPVSTGRRSPAVGRSSSIPKRASR